MHGMDYQGPEIVDLGDLQDVTAGQSSGDVTDRDFPAGTPSSDLTFS